ncbi:Uncharacterised protein r2_g1768 [Pycnogonum litorale]
MRELFENDNTEAVLLVDATNAFNSLNRAAMLHNFQKLCPILAPTVINIYRNNAELFTNGETIVSAEGTTQGDPLAMPVYAISTLPLINKINSVDVRQIWYADDAGAGGTIKDLRQWWNSLNEYGPDFGYFPNGSKTWLVVKKGFEELAREHFNETGVQFTSDGRTYLGSAIWTDDFVQKFVREKIETWIEEIKVLTNFAQQQPQCVYAAFTHGTISEWTYLTRTTPCTVEQLAELEKQIRVSLIPAITGRPTPNDTDRKLLSLPARASG